MTRNPSLVLGSLLVMALTACATPEPVDDKAEGNAELLAVDLHRDQGFAALQAERYQEAASYFQRILETLPEDKQARLGLGEAYLGQRRLDEALSQFMSLDEESEPSLQARALQGQGIVSLRRGDEQDALIFLDRALEQDPGLWRSWNALGRIYDVEKDYAGARKAFRRAIELNPTAAILHNNLGFSLLVSGEPAYAETSFNRALELNPGLDVAATNLRLALALQGRYAPALAVTSGENRAVVMNNVGYAALLRGDHQKAKTLFRDAMATAPSFFGEAKRNLAFLETIEDGRAQEP